MKRIKHFGIWVSILAILATGCNKIDKSKKLAVESNVISVKVDTIGKNLNETANFYIGTIEESFLSHLAFWLQGLQKKFLWMKDKW